MQLVHDRLKPKGVFIANLIGSLRTSEQSFIWSEIKTMQQVFPNIYIFGVESPTKQGTQNIMVVASAEAMVSNTLNDKHH